MYLVTIVTPIAQYKRKIFLDLHDAEGYIDYMANAGMACIEFAVVDTEIVDNFAEIQ